MEKKNFMWKVQVEDLLVQADLDQALKEKLEGMTDRQWMSLEKKACSVIRGCFTDMVLYSVLEERIPKGFMIEVAHHVYREKHV